MKLLCLFYFSLTVPIFIFLTTILYGGISPTVLKTELARARVYDQITSYIGNIQDQESGDGSQEELFTVIKSRFTPSYLQTKTETFIDDAGNYIGGTIETPPVLSFKEVKDDITSEYPDLLPSLQQLSEEMKAQQPNAEMADASSQDTAEFAQASEGIASLAKSDFTIPIGQNLKGVKDSYNVLKILHPVIAVLLILSLLLMGYLAHSWQSRWKWLGTTFIATGIIGFGAIFFNQAFTAGLSHIAIDEPNSVTAMVTPIALAIIQQFVETYVRYQGITSIVLFVIAAGCFIGANVSKPTSSPLPVKKTKVAKK